MVNFLLKSTRATCLLARCKTFARLSSAALAASLALFTASQSFALVNIQASPELSQTSIEIINQLKLNHYRYVSIDNEFSSKLFDKYLDELDPQRVYLLQKDIDKFSNYRYGLDNALNKGDLAVPFKMYTHFQRKVEDRIKWLIALLESDLDKMAFDVDESLLADRSELSWSQTENELDEIWRKRLKNAVLGLRMADKETPEIQELLTKRYQNQLNRLDQTRVEDAFQVYMNVVAQSYDPHTEYFAPRRSENFNINMSLSLEGIGAVLQSDQEYTKIVRLVPGGPADLSKSLNPTDRIVGVAQEDEEIVDVIGWRLDEVVELIRGPKGSKVTLQIIPKDAKNNETTLVSIVRNRVQLEEQSAQSHIIETGPASAPVKLGVIEIPTFYADFEAYQAGDPNYKSTTRDVRKLLNKLKKEGVSGVIIDLRNNGGGSLHEANALTGLFIKTGATVQVRNPQGRVKVYTDSDPEVAYEGPIAVLVNRLSASASEIFAGAIQDYERGIVIGGQTFGKGTVQTLLPVKQGQLKITQAKFYRISGESTQHQGIIPDIKLPPLFDLDEIGEDALDDALPWDTIRPVLFRPVGAISPYIGELEERHNRRIKTDPDYQFRLDQIRRIEENRARTDISLNEAVREKEQEISEQLQLSMENKRRTAKGLKTVSSLDELDEDKQQDEQAADENSDDEFEPDPYLVEGGAILADYIQLSRTQVAKVK